MAFEHQVPRTREQMKTILDTVLSHWQRNPHQRLTQLVANAVGLGSNSNDVFYVEDDKLLEYLKLVK